MRGRIVAAKLGRLHEMCGGVLAAPERAQHLRHVECAIRIAAIEREGTTDKLERGVVPAGLVCDQTEKVERMRMVTIEGKHVTAGALGRVERACAEVRHRRREQIVGKRARSGWRRERAARAALARRAPFLAVHASAAASLAA